MFRRRVLAVVAGASLVVSACASAADLPSGEGSTIGSFGVDESALVWGGRSLEETITFLRDVTGPPDDVDTTLATVGPVVSLPELPDLSVEGVEVFVTCTAPLFEPCDDLNVRTTAWMTTSASVDELQAAFVESPSFPSLEDDLLPGGLAEPTFTSTPNGDLIELHAIPDGAPGEFKARQLVEGVGGQISLEDSARSVASIIPDGSELRSVLFNIRMGSPVIEVEFATPGESEEAAAQLTVEALLADSWSEDDNGVFDRRIGDEMLTAELVQRRFRDGMLEELLTISAS